jgi:hypothetical protein
MVVSGGDLALWISGEYKISYTLFDDNDNNILTINGQGAIKRTK